MKRQRKTSGPCKRGPKPFRHRVAVRLVLMLAAILVGAALPPVSAGWTLQTSPTAQELLDVSFFSTTTGYAVGKSGGPSPIINTTDGGANWNLLPGAPPLEFHGVADVGGGTAYAVGVGGAVYKTVDSGTNWNPQASGTGNDLEDVVFTDAVTGWAVGASGTIIHTVDGGANWNPQASGTGVDLFGVSFADASNGWAVGGGGTILGTVNGGTTWAPQTSGVSSDLFSVSAPSNAVVYAVGKSGTIVKTIDGGNNWTQPTSPTSQDLGGTDFPTTTIGYAVGKGGYILKTDDGGANWEVQCSPTGQQLYAVDAPSTLVAYATGKGGTIVSTTDGGFFAGADISGIVFEDADFSGTPSDYDGGAVDLGLDKVDVELYDGTDTLVASKSTGGGGNYAFTCVANGTYKVRARSATIGDKNTLPKDGFHVACGIQDPPTGFACALAEMTWADGAALVGGQAPNVDDTATDDDNGPGDTYTDVTVAGSDLAGVNLGFAYYPIVKTSDGGQGSLRRAIRNANVIVGAPTIAVPDGTYLLDVTGTGEDAAATGDLDLTDELTVAGSDAATRIVDGVAADRVFDVLSGVTATLSGITITNGDAKGGRGGGIRNSGTLTVSAATVTGNTDSNEGGGIQNDGDGGAISLTVTNSTISGNTCPAGKGGGIHSIGATTFALTDVTLSGNSADEGGAIRNDTGTGTLTHVTIDGNSAALGGGILNRNGGALTLTDATISGNTSTDEGGGIQQQGTSVQLTNVTLTGNSASSAGGGLRNKSGTSTVQNTIIANSSSGGDCSGTITSSGGNLDTDGSCGFGLTANPLLGALQGNGGPTWTHALALLSPAVDAGINAGSPTTDQRGETRPFDGDGDTVATADIGAFESQQAPDTISGRALEDVNGDGGLGDAVAAAGVRVRLYVDNDDNGLVDGLDLFLSEKTTDVAGLYSFPVDTGTNGTKYLVAADSRTLGPSDGFNGGFGQDDVWAEQTYGDDPATPALDLGVRIGGRAEGTSDDVDPVLTAPANNIYQHLARVDVSGGSVSGVEFAFSYRAVSHVADRDDDLAVNRTAQGSLRQLVQNANAIAGAPTLDIPSGTYKLTLTGSGEDAALTGDLDITEDVTLTGASPSATTIDGNRTDRVFHMLGSTVQLSGLTVEKGDSQGDHAGGILVDATSSLTMTDTMVRDNDGDRGGGIQTENVLVVKSSTFYDNRGSQGGAIQSAGSTPSVTLTNVTISGNSATARGGGLELDLATLSHVTVTDNSSPDGGGIYRRGGQPFSIGGSIIAGNTGGGDCSNAFNSAGYNVDGDGTCALGGPGDISNGTTNLEPLGDNGGPTLTHALLAGSDAIDAVIVGCPPPVTDQRGTGRPIGTACDAGAYEGVVQPLTIVKRAFQSDGTPIASGSALPAGMPVKFILYVNNPGGLVDDVSLRDVLDPLFLYVGGSIRYDNSVPACAGASCTVAEEAAIFAAADSGTVGTDAVNGDVVSFSGVTLDVGNNNVANAQLDLAAGKVWAVVFTITMQ